MKTVSLLFGAVLGLWGQCGPGQQLAPQPVKNKTCINTPQVVVSAPVAVSALPAPSSQNVNQILVVSNTANCTTTSATTPMLCLSTGSAWAPVGGGGGAYVEPSSLASGLVAEYRLDEQVGRTAFNSLYPHVASNNLLGNSLTMLMQCNATCTNTANYASNRDGLMIASRVQVSGSNIAYSTPSPNVFASGMTYTLSLDAISNTGSAQTIRLGVDYGGAISGNLTVGTAWSRVSWTFTADSNSQYIILYPDAGGDAVDVSYDRLQLEYGSAPTAWDSHLFTVQLGRSLWAADTSMPSWSAPWLVFSGAQKAWGLGNWAPITLRTMSAYVVLQETSDSTPAAAFGNDAGTMAIWPTFNGGPSYAVAFGGTRVQPSCPLSGCIRIADGNPHVLAETYDGTTLRGYVDGVLVASTTASIAPQTISDLELGSNTYVDSGPFYFTGDIGYASLYKVAHTAAQVQATTALLATRMAAYGAPIPAWRNWVLFEGDSITGGTGGPWTSTVQAAVTTTHFPQGANTAVAGSILANVTSRESTDNATLLPSPTRNVLVLLVGANDMNDSGGAAGFEAALKAYCLAQKAAGWNKLVLLTLLPQTTAGFNVFRDAVNALIVADSSFYDALVSLDLDPHMGCDACAANTTYYQDGIHPTTTAGSNAIAADVLSVLESVLQ